MVTLDLQAEYHALIQKSWHDALSAEEEHRLEAIKADINARKASAYGEASWKRSLAQLKAELVAIRREVEALSDASAKP